MAVLDTNSPAFLRNPYPFYDELRRDGPIVYSEEQHVWFVSSYDACNRLLRDRRAGHDAVEGNPMVFQNPPVHSRLRQLVSHAFTPHRIEQLRTRVEQMTESLIDRIPSGEADRVSSVASPLPTMVIAELMGVPEDDWGLFAEWSRSIVLTFDPSHDADARTRCLDARTHFEAYLEGLFELRRTHPGDDFVSALMHVSAERDRLSTTELYTMCTMLLVAGHVTTVNLIANGVLALLRHPEQCRLLREREDGIHTAVEEFLRFDSPLQMTFRTVLQPFEFDGHRCREGDTIVCLLGAANRDPEQFVRPDELDITRSPNPHIAFGMGIHICLGAPLARLEGSIAIPAILRRLHGLELAAEELVYPESYVLRGPVSLPIRFVPQTQMM